MADLIDRQAAIDALDSINCFGWVEDSWAKVSGIIEHVPSAQPNLQPTCNQLATDCISRQTAIKAIENLHDCYNGFSDTYDKACIIGVLEEVPSAQPEYRMDEWCTDCKEYDHERHCCPRFNHVIRTTLQEVQAEQPKIIMCKDCLMHGVCRFELGLGLDGYCSQAERRTDE